MPAFSHPSTGVALQVLALELSLALELVLPIIIIQNFVSGNKNSSRWSACYIQQIYIHLLYPSVHLVHP